MISLIDVICWFQGEDEGILAVARPGKLRAANGSPSPLYGSLPAMSELLPPFVLAGFFIVSSFVLWKNYNFRRSLFLVFDYADYPPPHSLFEFKFARNYPKYNLKCPVS